MALLISEMIEKAKRSVSGGVIALRADPLVYQDIFEEMIDMLNAWAPRIVTEQFNVVRDHVQMPVGTQTVLQLYRTDPHILTEEAVETISQDIFTLTRRIGIFGSGLSYRADALVADQEVKSLQSFIEARDWFWRKETLDLMINGYTPSSVVITYVRDIIINNDDISDLEREHDLVQWAKKYMSARIKQVEGKIRKRFSQPATMLQNDGSDIFSEGTTEREALEEELKTKISRLPIGNR